MGYQNGPCGVTNLPIYEGGRVVLIPLMGRESFELPAGKGFIDNEETAEPIGVHIRGTYNGYYFEPDERSMALDTFAELMAAYVENGSRLHRIKEGSSKLSVVKRAPKGLELLAALENGSLAFKVDTKNAKPVGFGSMMVLESTFDKLVQLAGEEIRMGFYAQNGDFIKKKHAASNQLKLLLDIGKAYDEEAIRELDSSLTDALKKFGFTREHLQYTHAYALVMRRASFADSLLSRAITDDAALKVLTEFLLFRDAFDGLRKSWQIQCGLSQAGLAEYGAYYKVIADSIYESLAAHK